VILPFVLFPKQEEYIHWFLDHINNNKNGLVEKSREVGLTWVSIALAATLCLFNPQMVVGVGSRKEMYVDKSGDPKSLFYKAKRFIELLPREFRGEWTEKTYCTYMRLGFPNGSVITGEAGSSIGRGDRTTFTILDESAFFQQAELVDASLAATTNCRFDISTPAGRDNAFARKRFSGLVSVFTFHWRDDPRKDEAWYKDQCDKIIDPVIIAQELDINYDASVENVVIPSAWVQAAIDAHLIIPELAQGEKLAALDIADGGIDINAIVSKEGNVISQSTGWSGKDSDLFFTTSKAFHFCDEASIVSLIYDADGLGANVKGDARVINANRKKSIDILAFKGSRDVWKPDSDNVLPGRKNADYFANFKSQSWWMLRKRFMLTYRVLKEGHSYPASELISLSSSLKNLNEIAIELTQPTFTFDNSGKLLIDKKPGATKSPNYADAIMMVCSPSRKKQGIFDV
jgi:phage terminase large subunit